MCVTAAQLITLFKILVFVEGLDGVIFAEPSEGVDEMGAEIGVDVLRSEFGRARPVDGPVGEVADDPLVSH